MLFRSTYNQYYCVFFLSVASLAAFSTERITVTGDPDRSAQSLGNSTGNPCLSRNSGNHSLGGNHREDGGAVGWN